MGFSTFLAPFGLGATWRSEIPSPVRASNTAPAYRSVSRRCFSSVLRAGSPAERPYGCRAADQSTPLRRSITKPTPATGMSVIRSQLLSRNTSLLDMSNARPRQDGGGQLRRSRERLDDILRCLEWAAMDLGMQEELAKARRAQDDLGAFQGGRGAPRRPRAVPGGLMRVRFLRGNTARSARRLPEKRFRTLSTQRSRFGLRPTLSKDPQSCCDSVPRKAGENKILISVSGEAPRKT